MINIGEKAKGLLDHLHRDGIGGFRYPDASLWRDHTADYAIIENLVVDTFFLPSECTDYIDFSMIDYDLSHKAKDWFASEGETVVLVREHEKKRDQDLPQQGSFIVVRHEYGSIEVYRMVDGGVLCNQQED
jgi:hypothetical protein